MRRSVKHKRPYSTHPQQFLRFKSAGKRHGSAKNTYLNNTLIWNRRRPNCNQTKQNRRVHKVSNLGYPNSTQIGDIGTYETLTGYGSKDKEVRLQELYKLDLPTDEKARQEHLLKNPIDCDHIVQKALALYSPTAKIKIKQSTPSTIDLLLKEKGLQNKLSFLSKLITLLCETVPFSNEEKAKNNSSWGALKTEFQFICKYHDMLRKLSEKAPTIITLIELVNLANAHRFSKTTLSKCLEISARVNTQDSDISQLRATRKKLISQLNTLQKILKTSESQLHKDGLCIAVPTHFHRQTRTYQHSPTKNSRKGALFSNNPKKSLATYFNSELLHDYQTYFDILKNDMSKQQRNERPSPDGKPLDPLYFIGALRYHYKQSIKHHGLPESKDIDILFKT